MAVCVEVSGPSEICPVPFPFRLTLSPLRGTAGEAGMFYNEAFFVSDYVFHSLQILIWITWDFLKN